MAPFRVLLKYVENGMVVFNYSLLYKVHRFINKVINIILLVVYGLIFFILRATY